MVNEMIMLDAANSIERLMESGLSLRGIARKIDRSPSYISLIRNRKAEASMATYKLLLTLEMERKLDCEHSSAWERIERIEHPPLECTADRPYVVLPRAIRVVLTDGTVMWSRGDRSWYGKVCKERLEAAHAKYWNAKKEYDEAVERYS